MKLISYPGVKGSVKGSVTIEGLQTNDKGQVEPIIVIKGSEPSCSRMAIAWLDSVMSNSSYREQFRFEAKEQLSRMQAWNAANQMQRELDDRVTNDQARPTATSDAAIAAANRISQLEAKNAQLKEQVDALTEQVKHMAEDRTEAKKNARKK